MWLITPADMLGHIPTKKHAQRRDLILDSILYFFILYLDTSHVYLLLINTQKIFTSKCWHQLLCCVTYSAAHEIPWMCRLTWLIIHWPRSRPRSSRVLKSFGKCKEFSWRNDLMVLGRTLTCHHMIIKTVGYVELASRAEDCAVPGADQYSWWLYNQY